MNKSIKSIFLAKINVSIKSQRKLYTYYMYVYTVKHVLKRPLGSQNAH